MKITANQLLYWLFDFKYFELVNTNKWNQQGIHEQFVIVLVVFQNGIDVVAFQ